MADIIARLANMTRDGYRYYDHHDGDAVHCAIQDAGKEITTLRARIDKLEQALGGAASLLETLAEDLPEGDVSAVMMSVMAERASAALDQDKGGGNDG